MDLAAGMDGKRRTGVLYSSSCELTQFVRTNKDEFVRTGLVRTNCCDSPETDLGFQMDKSGPSMTFMVPNINLSEGATPPSSFVRGFHPIRARKHPGRSSEEGCHGYGDPLLPKEIHSFYEQLNLHSSAAGNALIM